MAGGVAVDHSAYGDIIQAQEQTSRILLYQLVPEDQEEVALPVSRALQERAERVDSITEVVMAEPVAQEAQAEAVVPEEPVKQGPVEPLLLM